MPNGTAVYTSPAHRVGADSLLLGRFCPLRPDWRGLDLGAGCGILLFSLLDRGLKGPSACVEMDAQAAELLRQGVRHNQFSQVEVIQQDFRSYHPSSHFDLVVANPPYFSEGPASPDPVRAGARHQQNGTLNELCQAVQKNLKQKGRFCLCYPASRLSSLFYSLESHRLVPKRLQLVRSTPEASPRLALVEARLDAGEGLQILPSLIENQPD